MGCYEVELATMKFRFSDGLYRIFGNEPQSFVPTMELIDARSHPDDAAPVRGILANAITNKSPYYYSRRIYRPDGEMRVIESHGKAQCDAEGNLVKFIGVVRDITEQKRSEALIRSITDTIPDVVMVIALPSRRIEFINRDPLQRAGYVPEEIMAMTTGERISAFIHPGDAGQLEEYYNRLEKLKGDAVATVEYRIRRKNGELAWLHLRGKVLYRDDKGVPTHTLQVGQNVTWRKIAEQELIEVKDQLARQANDRYRTLFNSMDEGYILVEVIFDEQDVPVDILYLEANPAAVKMAGTDLTGRHTSELDPDYERHWYEIFGRVARTGVGERHELSARPLNIYYDFYVFKPGAEKDNKVAAIYKDISGRKRREANAAFLLKLSDAMRPVADPLEVQSIAAKLLGKHLQASRVHYGEVNEACTHMFIHNDYTDGIVSLTGSFRLHDFSSPQILKLCNGETLVVSGSEQDTGIINNESYASAGIAAYVGIPLVKDGRLRAVLSIHQNKPRTWTQDEITLIRETAERTWASVERAQAEAALRASEKKYRIQLEHEVNQRTAELKESKQLLQTIYDSLTIGISILTPVYRNGAVEDFRIKLVNKELEKKTGRGDLAGKLYTKVFPSVRQAGLFDIMLRVMRTGTSESFEFHDTDKNTDKWYASMFVKTTDGLIATNADITSQKEAGRQLNEQLHFINQVTVTIPDMLSVMELDTHNMIYANTQPFLMNGFDFDRMKTLSVEQREQIIYPDDLKAVQDYFQNFRQYADDQIQSLEYRARNDDGAWMWYRVRGKVFKRDAQGHPVQCVNIVQNINELKVAEEELLNLKLRQQREIINAIILAQEQERQRIGEALHNGVAQLLYGIQTRMQLLRMTSEEDKKNIREILAIVSDAINDTRRISFELVPAVLKDYGIEVALRALFQKIIRDTPHIKLEAELDERLPEKLESAVYRIIQELVNNIIKHSQASDAVVRIRYENNTIALFVTDNGTGFDETERRTIHKGLGLQSIKNRVKLLEGSFTIESGPGGTAIYIVLPVEK